MVTFPPLTEKPFTLSLLGVLSEAIAQKLKPCPYKTIVYLVVDYGRLYDWNKMNADIDFNPVLIVVSAEVVLQLILPDLIARIWPVPVAILPLG